MTVAHIEVPGKLALFGYVVTGRFTDSSDIGILVDCQ
jgi:predicted nucleotidyltransferase